MSGATECWSTSAGWSVGRVPPLRSCALARRSTRCSRWLRTLSSWKPKVAPSQSKRSARKASQARASGGGGRSAACASAATAARTSGSRSDGRSPCITTSWIGMMLYAAGSGFPPPPAAGAGAAAAAARRLRSRLIPHGSCKNGDGVSAQPQ